MSIKRVKSKLRFQKENDIRGDIERRLKRKYGRGIFIDNYVQSDDGTFFIKLGNASPQDVSDRRDHDRVLKFIEYNSIYTLEAEPTSGGYIIQLPERREVYDGFEERRGQLARRLDRSMARAIYRQLVNFPAVENQLGAIQSIVRTVWEEGPLDRETVHLIRGTTPNQREKTNNYLYLLEDTEFVRIDENDTVRSGQELDSFDLNHVQSERFSQIVLGQLVEKAYSTLKDELNITLLAHYPKYANAYYFTALERNKPDVRLDAKAARDNLESLYGDDEHEIKVRQKLDDLANVDVVEKDDEGFYQSEQAVFEALTQQTVA